MVTRTKEIDLKCNKINVLRKMLRMFPVRTIQTTLPVSVQFWQLFAIQFESVPDILI